MSGCHGGVQKLLQDRLGKVIPYVHCFNHQLHLVIVHAMGAVPQARNFFLLCEQLYVFFKRHFVSNIYDGQSLKRLLVQRWTGHLQCALAVKNSRKEIVDALEIVSESDAVSTQVSVEAQGLLAKVSKPEFAFQAAVAVKVLSLLVPANSMMQGKSCNIMLAAELLTSAREAIIQLRSDTQFDAFATEAGMLKDDQPTRPQRTRTHSKLLANFLVTSTLGATGSTNDNTGNSNWDIQKQAYFALLDSVAGEMTARFEGSSLALLQAIEALLPSSKSFMKLAAVKPLADLLQLQPDALAAELSVATGFLQKKLPSDATLESAAKEMTQLKDAFPSMYSLYAAALTIGVSTATCENSFSTLTRILQPHRRSMTHARKAELVLLAFEKNLTRQIDINEFISEFATSSQRVVL